MDQGEEKLKEYINARSMIEILQEHHVILKKLNTTGSKLRDRIFDYYLYFSSADEQPFTHESMVVIDDAVSYPM